MPAPRLPEPRRGPNNEGAPCLRVARVSVPSGGWRDRLAAESQAMTDQTDDLQDLLARLQQGDQLALAELFARHRDRLGRMVAFRLDERLRGRVAASDVLQEAYIDALKRLPHYQAEPGMPFFLWLRWVTVQRLIEVHRQHLGARIRDAGREVSIDR